jgi:hypothetical protein
MLLGETELYKSALDALTMLKEEHGGSEQIRAIAKFFLYACKSEVPQALFPFVGDEGDERDRAVVRAYEDAWRSFLNGEDD